MVLSVYARAAVRFSQQQAHRPMVGLQILFKGTRTDVFCLPRAREIEEVHKGFASFWLLFRGMLLKRKGVWQHGV